MNADIRENANFPKCPGIGGLSGNRTPTDSPPPAHPTEAHPDKALKGEGRVSLL
jgi:hypothetical protein